MRIHVAVLFFFLIFLYILLPIILRLFGMKRRFGKIFYLILLFMYILTILVLTLTKVSFAEIVEIDFVNSGVWGNKQIYLFEKFGIVDVLINLSMLTPVGIFIYSQNRKLYKNVLFSFCFGGLFGLVIELLQFILPIYRTVQIQDILFNSISAVLGMIVMHVLCLVYAKVNKERLGNGKIYKSKNNG